MIYFVKTGINRYDYDNVGSRASQWWMGEGSAPNQWTHKLSKGAQHTAHTGPLYKPSDLSAWSRALDFHYQRGLALYSTPEFEQFLPSDKQIFFSPNVNICRYSFGSLLQFLCALRRDRHGCHMPHELCSCGLCSLLLRHVHIHNTDDQTCSRNLTDKMYCFQGLSNLSASVARVWRYRNLIIAITIIITMPSQQAIVASSPSDHNVHWPVQK